MRRTNLVSLFAILFAVLPAPVTSARDIFVDNQSGSDRADGSSATSACLTIRRGLALAENGDRILLKKTGQPYRESVTLQASRHSGSATRPFEIVGNGATLDGSVPVPTEAWEHHEGSIFRFRPAALRHQILYLDGKPAQRRLPTTDKLLPKLEPLQWSLLEGNIYFRAEPNKLLREYELSHTSLPVGITIYEARNIVIRDLVVQGFQLDGINAHDGALGTSLIGLVCRGNGRSGISVGGASRVRVIECLVGDNGKAQVRTEGQSKTELIRCDLLDNTAPAVVREGGEVTRVDE
jgi:hypothetical protein